MRRRTLVASLAVLVCLVPASAAIAAPIWRLEQPAPPAGVPFKVPLGTPGDLKCWSANRCLLAVEGNAAVPRGLLYWNGASWRQLSSVCGGTGDSTRIAWAGPTEFWTITEPSKPRVGTGTALCHFVNGQVVASISTADQSPDPYRRMLAAACSGPSDCWFAGVGSQDPAGERVGAFHLHWDGAALTTSYAPQGRAVSDLEPFGGWWESTLVGRAPENTTDPIDLVEFESPFPRLLHRIAPGPQFINEPFAFEDPADAPTDGTELLALDADGEELWAGGGGAASGQTAGEAGEAGVVGVVERPPAVARFAGGTWQQVVLDPALYGDADRIVDIAAVPGSDEAWAAVQPYAERGSTNAKAKVARIRPDGTSEVIPLPGSGSGRGSAMRIEFTSPTEGWMVTRAGWLFHFTDGTPLPLDTEPAFQSLIAFRPNEAAEQFIPDAPPVDDSNLFAPPPIEAPPTTEAPAPKQRKLKVLMHNVKTRVVKKRVLVFTFKLARKAKIALIAIRKKAIVARSKRRSFRKGRGEIRLVLNTKRWPTRLKLSVVDSGIAPGTGDGGSGDSITTGNGAPVMVASPRRAAVAPGHRS